MKSLSQLLNNEDETSEYKNIKSLSDLLEKSKNLKLIFTGFNISEPVRISETEIDFMIFDKIETEPLTNFDQIVELCQTLFNQMKSFLLKEDNCRFYLKKYQKLSQAITHSFDTERSPYPCYTLKVLLDQNKKLLIRLSIVFHNEFVNRSFYFSRLDTEFYDFRLAEYEGVRLFINALIKIQCAKCYHNPNSRVLENSFINKFSKKTFPNLTRLESFKKIYTSKGDNYLLVHRKQTNPFITTSRTTYTVIPKSSISYYMDKTEQFALEGTTIEFDMF